MRRTLCVSVTALMLVLVAPPATRASFDLTGGWSVVLQSVVGPLDGHFDFVQNGTQLDLTYSFQGGAPQGPYTGTIDPDTGTFDVPLPDSGGPIPCSGNHIDGTPTADGQTINGNAVSNFFNIHFCMNGGGPYVATRDVCGNGVVQPGETCDDGNVADGDCCSADCSTAAPDDTPCDDGNTCTSGDHCAAGACVPTSTLTCDPCEACTPSGCAVPTDLGCQPPLAGGKSSVTLRDDAADGSKDSLVWSWKSSAPVAVGDFGDPTATSDYALCVIDHTGGVPTLRMSRSVPAGGPCGDHSCWSAHSTHFAYKNKAATPAGITALGLSAGSAAGKGKIGAKGKGALLGVPSGTFAPPLTVRVLRDDAATCWEATYSTPKTNDGRTFKAKSD
jgi:cysteine-rich repeat protein